MRVQWRRLCAKFKIWRYAASSGLTVLMVIIFIRMNGLLQVPELTLFDTFLHLRLPEATDEHVVIVGINEDDINKVGKYPIPDGEIAELLDKLATYQPRAIGLDIFKNVSIEPGHDKLVKTFKEYKNIFGINKVLEPSIPAPDSIPSDRIGFADVNPDIDGKYRRYILYTPDPKEWENQKQDHFSLALQLAKAYLKPKGYTYENGINDQNTIRFGKVELPRVVSNFGGYVDKDDTGELKILVNFRSGDKPFRIFSLNEIKTGRTSQGKIDPKWLRDKIILVGNVSPSGGDRVHTLAVSEQKIPGLMYGVEYHAHATSQIINAVLNNRRPMLTSWAESWEYIWIVVWGVISINIGRSRQLIWEKLIFVAGISFSLMIFGYIILLFYGTWIPIIPCLFTLIINVALSPLYQHEKLLRSIINERQRTIDSKMNTIDHTFRVIHNGPLQTLAYGLKHLKQKELPQNELIQVFEKLNKEIRALGEDLKQEALTDNKVLRLGNGLKINLNNKIHDLFYEVFSSTIERDDLEYFQTLKIKSRIFDPIDEKYLNMEYKRKLCLFLEESLCNVGKHARGVKRVEASGTYLDGFYTLCIKDNGLGLLTLAENKGTQDSQNLAQILNGSFKRKQIKPHGVLCELSWQLTTFVQGKH